MSRLISLGIIAILSFGVSSQAAISQVEASEIAPHNSLHPSDEERIFCDVCSVLNPDLIPAPFQGQYVREQPVCGTGAIQAAMQNWNRLSSGSRAKLATLFQRPSNQRSFTSPSGRFLIHYDISGANAVSSNDSDGDGIPDYVEFTATTFDDVWVRQIDELGYLPPPDDGDGLYDVHIQQLGLQGVYGLAINSGGSKASSYIQIDNNFTDNIFLTRGNDGVQVTAAHEFFHAIQFAYYAPFDARWWQELTATWMEDVIYDDVNDYYQYQPFLFQSPETALDEGSFSSFQPFAGAVFAHHVEQMYGLETIRESWESLGTRTPSVYDISDIDVAMPGGFASVLPRYVVWNYLTGSRHLSHYYEEGASYNEVSPRVVSPVSGVLVGGSLRMDHMATGYVSVQTSGLSGGLQISLSLESGSTYEVVLMLMVNGTPRVIRANGSDITIANVSRYDEVVIAPISTSLTGSNFDVGYSILNASSVTTTSDIVGDFDNDGSVAFADFLEFVESFGTTAKDIGHVRFHDLDADGEVGFNDFLIFANHFGESR